MLATVALCPRRIGRLCLAALAAAAVAAALPAGADDRAVKAAFVYQFGTYVEWPPAALADTPRLQVCVIGDDAFTRVLDTSLRDKRLHARPVAVRPASAHDRLVDCHILFIAAPARPELRAILSAVDRQPILTIGDDCPLRGGGVMIEFMREDDRLRFAVDSEVARRAGLTISSQLLKLAVGAASDATPR